MAETRRRPQIAGLNLSATAEVLLRVGTLTGWLGSSNQTAGAQEHAKNLITESIRIFESQLYTKKILEGQTEIAYCYWREGAYDEARIILKGVIEGLATDSELKAKAVLRSAIVECSDNCYSNALCTLLEYAALFEKINNHTLKGALPDDCLLPNRMCSCLTIILKSLEEGREVLELVF